MVAWSLFTSALFGVCGAYAIVNNPDQIYPIAIASVCIYASVLGIGNWLINQRRRREMFK